MADTLFIVPIQMWVYGMVRNTAIRFWLFNRAFLLAGFLIEALTDWLSTEFFGPAISDISILSEGLMPTFFMIATLLLVASYLIAPWFRVRVVDWQKALGWLLFALLFYQAGPGLYIEGENMRRSISSEFYGQILTQTEGTAAPTMLGTIATGSDDNSMGTLANQFGAYIPSDQYVDGLDLAMSYSLSTGEDVIEALTSLPADFRDEYFDPTQGPLFFLTMTAEERTDSINEGLTGISRLIFSLIIIFFGLVEQMIYLSLSISAGVLFLSMSIAILFSFFERTEMMARTLLDMWLELFILSVIISVMQAFVVGIVMLGARTANPTLALGAATLGAPVMLVLLKKALGTIWDALNRMFTAMSQVVGGKLTSPAEAGLSAAQSAAGLALSVATAGVGAGVAMAAGGSLAQVAGSALSGSDALYNAAAMGSMVLPEGSPLSETAGGFYEGALAQRMLGPAGGLMLGRRGGAGDVVATDGAAAATGGSGRGEAAPAGETDIRLDAADIAALRMALQSAVSQAIQQAPTGGYADQQAALAAIQTALGGTGHNPRMGDYLDRRAQDVSSYVMVQSQQPSAPAAKGKLDVTVHSDKTQTTASAQPAGAHQAPPTGQSTKDSGGYQPPKRL